MRFARSAISASVLSLFAVFAAQAQPAPSVDTNTINKIADAGFKHGEVMDTVQYLTDQIGGRMTNSPAMRKAEKWTMDKLKAWGLSDVRKDGFEFGRGWWIESSHVRVVAPRPIEVKAIPIAWTPGTNGVLKAQVIVAPMRAEKDFAEYKGKLKGKIVLVSWPAPPKDDTEPAFKRQTPEDINRLDRYRLPDYDPEAMKQRREFTEFRTKLQDFLVAEGAVASAIMSRSEGRLVHGEGNGYRVGKTPKLPQMEIGAEDYRRIARLAKVGEVRMEVEHKVHFDDSDTKAYNVLADIPGADPKNGYVMAGAHLDSWVAADGATDNAAGVAVVMEAARILQSLGVKPKRGIRFALWTGEEQGLWGSAAYVDKYLAKRPTPTDPKVAEQGPFATQDLYPIQTLPGFADMKAYFNMDNGSGKLRGIYTEGNFAVVPVFRQWLMPFASLGASAVVAAPTGSTDHVFLQRLGLPAFQFIQDPLDYSSRTHHTDVDTFDHLRADDLRQAAVVMASVLYQAANSNEPLSPNVLPTQPKVTDPFAYPDPSKKP